MAMYWAWLALSGAARALPRRVSYALAKLVGQLAFVLWPRGRRAAVRNFRTVLGNSASESAVRKAARLSFVNYGRYLVDFGRFPAETAEEVAGLVTDDDGVFMRLAKLNADGTGVVVAGMHFGNWDAGAAAATQRGLPLSAVGESLGHHKLDDAIFGARERLGMEIIPMDGGGFGMYRALKHGRFLAIIVDRPTPGEGVPVQFFGRQTWVPDGAARMALRTGAHVVAAACYRKRPGKPEFAMWADFDVAMPGDPQSEDAPRELMQAIFTAHERIIRRRPAQWYMFRHMWPQASGE